MHTGFGSRQFHWLVLSLCALAIASGCASRNPQFPAAPAVNSVAGRVISAAGQPLGDVTVFLVVAGGSAGDRLLARSVTDYLGRFSFTDPILWYEALPTSPEKAQRYYVFANSSDHGFSFATILKGDRFDGLTIHLVRPEVTRVKVADQDGKPLKGALVYYAGGGISEEDGPELDSAHRWSHLDSDVGISSDLTDVNGEVSLPGLYEGSIWRARKPGFASSTGSSLITLLPGTRLFGNVTYPDGTPASNAVVKCTYSGRSFWEEQTTTDDIGRYTFDDAPIPPKPTADDPSLSPSYAVEVNKADSPFVTAATTRPSDRQTRLDLQLQRACIVSGKVVDDRTRMPIPGIRMSAKSLPAGHDIYTSDELTTDAEGHFEATVPSGTQLLLQWQESPSGDYVLDREWMKSQPGDYAVQPLNEAKITADKTNIVLPVRLMAIRALTGTVVGTNGKPMPGVSIYLSSRVAAAQTDQKGSFTISAVPSDRDFELCAISRDKSLACVARLAKGSRSAQLQLKPTAMCQGSATTLQGTPAGRLTFFMDLELNGKPLPQLREAAATDSKGKFTVRVIPGARYAIAWPPDQQARPQIAMSLVELSAPDTVPDPIQAAARLYVEAIMEGTVDPSRPSLSNDPKTSMSTTQESVPATQPVKASTSPSKVAATQPADPIDELFSESARSGGQTW